MKQLFFLFLASLIIGGCGSDESSSSTQQNSQAKQETTDTPVEPSTEPSQDASSEAIVLTSNDMMQYDQKELTVKEGQEITLTLKHEGKLPKTAMGHNFVLLKPGVDIADFALKAVAAIDNGYIPEGDDVIVHTNLIGGGESTTITFTAPAKGIYDYICSFPGHYSLMQGKLIVE
ncbi:MAG: azurin [Bacteroidota bacterium]